MNNIYQLLTGKNEPQNIGFINTQQEENKEIIEQVKPLPDLSFLFENKDEDPLAEKTRELKSKIALFKETHSLVEKRMLWLNNQTMQHEQIKDLQVYEALFETSVSEAAKLKNEIEKILERYIPIDELLEYEI